MKIGFDFDKVFIDYPPFVPDALINRLYKQKSNGLLLYRVPSKAEQFIRTLSHYHLFRPPIKENVEYIRKLSNSNTHKYYLISSRFSFLKDKTESIVKKHKFEKIFNSMFFNFKDQQPHVFKDQVIKKMKIDRYVDDDLPLLEYMSRNNPNAKFFWLNEKESITLTKNLFAIRHLSEMFAPNFHLRGVPRAQHHLGGGEATTSTPPR